MQFRAKYRVETTRLAGWDYSAAGWYFVTICTKGHSRFLGDVVDGEMHLSVAGRIVADEWRKTRRVRPYVALGEWVIMPNHIHGILVLSNVHLAETAHRAETPHRGVSTGRSWRPRSAGRSWKPRSIGSILGQFKSVCTKRIWAAGHTRFAWQPRFHDHIIRNESSLQKIRDYIRTNPQRWSTDRYYNIPARGHW